MGWKEVNDKEELIKKKIVGLFHDPPWKPWVISKEIKKDSFRCEGEISVINFGGDAHENQGLTVAMKILNANDDEIKELMNYVRNSDILSAALDRYLNAQKEITEQKEKVNILNPTPDLKYPLEVKPKNIDGFVCEIIETSEKLKNAGADLTLLYNYLYGNIELMWYKYNDKALPLADTRVKTYSVFDHLYSTVSLLNWFDGKAFKGYLVKVDIPGVQDIISRSRKIYDLWGGSWIVSALLFFTILPFIEEYGADVVLSPFMGLNPFFHSYLRSRLQKNRDLDYMRGFDASQPVMPATAYLALPRDENDVEKAIRDNYLNAWKKIVETVTVNERLKEEFEKIKDYPIVPIRVSVKKVNIETSMSDVDLVIEFDRLFREEFDEPRVKFSYGISAYPLAKELSEGLYRESLSREKKELYKQCTNCGILPAFILKESETKTRLYNGEKVEDDKDLEEGEALCHYCYLRRKLHNATFKELEVEPGIIPSTIDLANLDNWKKIMRKCAEIKEVKGGKKAELPKSLEEFKDCDNCKAVWYKYAIEGRFFVKKVENRKYEVNDDFKECFNAIKDANLYYAIVKGDGDFIGKRVWKGVVKMSLEDYIRATRENVKEKLVNEFADKFRGYLRNVYNCSNNQNSEACKNIKNIIPITPDYLIAVSRSLMLVALKDLETVQNYGVVVYAGGDDIAFLSPLKIPVEDPYKMGRDRQIKNTAIGLVKLTRRNYWGVIPGEELKPYGFIYFNFKNGINVIFDLPALYGRSYSIFVAHYKDPFYAMWGIASELEEMKDEAEASDERQKDLTFVLGGRGTLNLKDAAVLENRIKAFEAIEALYENIGKGLSKNFVKDYLSAYHEVKNLNGDLDDYLDKLLDYVIERNKKGREGENVRGELRDLRRERRISEEWRKVYDPRVEVVKTYDYLEE